MFSPLAFWLGGAGSAPFTVGGAKSMLAFWLGGAGVPSGNQGGFNSMTAFWLGGAGSDGGGTPPAVEIFRGYPPPCPQMMGVTVNG